jgi:hypothetical protein
MNAITFGKGVPAFGKAAAGGFGRKGDTANRDDEAPKQDGALDAARTVLEAATAASLNGRQPSTSDLLIIGKYFQ